MNVTLSEPSLQDHENHGGSVHIAIPVNLQDLVRYTSIPITHQTKKRCARESTVTFSAPRDKAEDNWNNAHSVSVWEQDNVVLISIEMNGVYSYLISLLYAFRDLWKEWGDTNFQAPNDTAYKWWSCQGGYKLPCKLCRNLPPPAMGSPIYRFGESLPC